MNFFKSKSNKKGMSGAVKVSIILLTLAFVVASVSYIVPVLAVHTSHAIVTPLIVKGGLNYEFTATIYNDGGDSISEFRIYNNTAEQNGGLSPFTNLVCYPADGWYGPVYMPSSTGDFCQYTAKTISDQIVAGQNKIFKFSADAPTTDCWRNIMLETRDPKSYYTPLPIQIAVDANPPVTTKSFDGPQKIKDGVEWIDGVTKVVLTPVDPEPHPAGVDKTWYLNVIDLTENACWNPAEYCKPTTVPSPYASGEGCINSGQEICSKDFKPYTKEWYDCVENYAHKECSVDPLWKLYKGPFNKAEESCHVLQFFSVDNVGNIEPMNTNCFFVDKTPPEIKKVVGDQKVEGNHNPVDWWVTQNTPITLNCKDVGPHPSDDVTIYWNYTVDGGKPVTGSHKGESYELKFKEDSVHVLEFWCKDAVEKESNHDIETFKVDTAAPIITKTVLGPQVGKCPPSPGDTCYIKDTLSGDGTTVHVEVADPDPTGYGCNVDKIKCEYFYYLDDGTKKMGFVDDSNPPFDIQFSDDSKHELHIKCWDALKNKYEDVETFLVDSTPPTTTKTYGNPTWTEGGYRWITSDTPIDLSANDVKVGVDKIYWRVTQLFISDESCLEACKYEGSGIWQEKAGTSATFTIGKESCHLIEYYSVDKLGNIETTKYQCVFVDNTPPKTDKTFDGKVVDKDGYKYINQNTEIKLTCSDQNPHPVDHSVIWYRYRISDDCKTWGEWTPGDCKDGVKDGWCDTAIAPEPAQKIIKFPEDSCHQLEYYCVDALGNKETTQSEIDVVDTKAPVITKSLVGPSVGNCPGTTGTGDCYIKDWNNGHGTTIHVTAIDQDPHPVDSVKCEWFYTVDGGDKKKGSDDTTPPFDIEFYEDSTHIVTIKCWDALGNKATDTETFYVDSTPPTTHKTYGTPCYGSEACSSGDNGWELGQTAPEVWITSQTSITLDSKDGGEICHVDNDKTYYRVTPMSTEYCKNCDGTIKSTAEFQPYETPFTISEDSCHLIEFYSEDALGNTEPIKHECVYVDNQAPTVTKIIGDPHETWEGDDTFYLGLKARCAASEIDCWKVTLGTPLNLTCSDQEPHPVDHNKLCFQIELDGDDKTQTYCDENHYNGDFNKSGDGYCCVNGDIENFQFIEESQHDLKIKCTDALGNAGPVDEEKFKVEGCPEQICLNKKWNLISVPFVLFNDSPDTVFKDVKDEIVSVWSYDEDGWHVWTPDGEESTLTSIEPGWGYWVLSKEDRACFEIAGSLFSPQTIPPSRTLQEGWNLIGYYGNTGLNGLGFFEVDHINPQCFIADRPVYCALNSLVDTQVGFPRWSSLYTYYNNGGDNSYWDGLDACVGKFWGTEYMKPGQGYWIEMDVQDGYAPATNCIWNTDLKCVPEFPFPA